MRYTTTTLKKLEESLEELDYTVRYEKGSFQSGYCLVENRRMAVVNKFYDTEARINCLLDILTKLTTDHPNLSEKTLDLLRKAKTLTDSSP